VTSNEGGRRAAQRRRTRRAIVQATTDLVLRGDEVSVGVIATAADVSVRTVYDYFPTLDALLLEATLNGLSTDIAQAAHDITDDACANVDAVIERIFASVERHLPLGRKLIKLTIEAPVAPGTPRRGYRRIEWIESALAPIRNGLEPDRFEDLVSALSVVIGWEAIIVLTDIRGLDLDDARRVTSTAARTLIEAALTQPN
jgi:AcrR family transcriptional regulator